MAVILGGIVAYYQLSKKPDDPKAVSINFKYVYSDQNDTLTIINKGGDNITRSEYNELLVYVNKGRDNSSIHQIPLPYSIEDKYKLSGVVPEDVIFIELSGGNISQRIDQHMVGSATPST